MFYHHDDKRFKKIIDDYILSSSDDHSLLSAIEVLTYNQKNFESNLSNDIYVNTRLFY